MPRWLVVLVVAACGSSPPPSHPVAITTGVSGRVIDDYGGPVTHFGVAVVTSFEHDLGPDIHAIDGATGKFAVEAKPGTWKLAVVAMGFAPALQSIEVVPGHTVEVGTIRLKHNLTLRGLVTDESGAPVAGALVEANPVSSFLPPADMGADDLTLAYTRTAMATTDERGRFRLTGLGLVGETAVSAGYQVRVTTKDGRASLPEAIAPNAEDKTIVVAPTGGIDVTVTGSIHATVALIDANGAAVESDLIPDVPTYSTLPRGDYSVVLTEADGSVTTTPVTVVAGTRVAVPLVAHAAPPVEVTVHVAKFACVTVELTSREHYDRTLTAKCLKRDATLPAVEPGGYLACAVGGGHRSCSFVEVTGSQHLDL